MVTSFLIKASFKASFRMEREENVFVYKQRKRFLNTRKGSLLYEETPFSNGEGRFLISTKCFLCYEEVLSSDEENTQK